LKDKIGADIALSINALLWRAKIIVLISVYMKAIISNNSMGLMKFFIGFLINSPYVIAIQSKRAFILYILDK
jgi:hypothetical protein